MLQQCCRNIRVNVALRKLNNFQNVLTTIPCVFMISSLGFLFSLHDFWSNPCTSWRFRSCVRVFCAKALCWLRSLSCTDVVQVETERRREKDCGIRWTCDVGSWTRRSMRKPLANQATVASSITFNSLLLRATCTAHQRYNQTCPRQSGDQTHTAKQRHHTHKHTNVCRNVSMLIGLSNINNIAWELL